MNLGGALIIVLIGMLFFQFAFLLMAYQITDKLENQDVFELNQSRVSDDVRDRIIKEITETNKDVVQIKQALNITN